MNRLALACVVLAGCSGSGTVISMDFSRAKSLYDAPFPSDDLRLPNGHIDVSKIPNPNHVELIDEALALLANDARGFAQGGAIYFRSSAPLDPASLPDLAGSTAANASVFVVGLDPAQPDFMTRIPIDVAFVADGGPFGDANLLALLPVQGVPLAAGRTYAAVVLRTVRDVHGQPLDAATTVGPFAAAVSTLAASGIDRAKVAGLTVFTTDDPTAELKAVRADLLARTPPVVAAPTRGEIFDDYCVYNTTIAMPDYQSGDPPYQTSGGAWVFDAGGKPIVDHSETARLVFTVPRAPAPAGGWPATIFVRTGGGGDRPLVDRGVCATEDFTTPIVPGSGPARELARVGFAGVQVDGPLGGMRNTTMADEQFLVFNVFNASALRDNVRESAVELTLLANLLPSVQFDASDCPGAGVVKFDAQHLALMGHSMGGWIAPLALAFEPRFGATVLSGAGGSYIANVMDKVKPVKVRPLAEILLDYNMDARSLERHDPALTIVQWAAEPSDPQAYDAHVTQHVLMLQGIVDHYILPSIANATSLALGLDQAGPAYDASNAEEQSLGQTPLATLLPLAGSAAIALPASLNRPGRTAVVVQHPGDAIEDGHEVVFQTEPPKHQYRCFLQSFVKGAPSVPPDGAADDPCP